MLRGGSVTNMKKTFQFAAILVLLVGASFAQVQMVPITLSSAVSSTSATSVVLSAITGLNSNSYSIAAGSSYLWVDGEYMSVNSIAGGTTVNVTRGYGGTRAFTHASGAYVFVGPANFFGTQKPGLLTNGSCTRSNFPALPRPNIATQTIGDCVGGVWVNGDSSSVASQFQIASPQPGAVAYTSINTTGTTLSATTQYCTEMVIPYNKVLTGLGVLNGTTVGTDAHIVALYDSSGNLLANSALAGTTAASASAYQSIAFTKLYYAVGPARYYGCLQTNGTTATVRMTLTGINDTQLTKGQTGVTFGTLPTLTVPTSFATAVGPYFIAY